MPPARLWDQELVSSRLLEYEVWTRIHAKHLSESHGESVRSLVSRIALLEMIAPVLTRALEPFPVRIRTLDALHLASIEFLKERLPDIQLASYDSRMLAAARKLEIRRYKL